MSERPPRTAAGHLAGWRRGRRLRQVLQLLIFLAFVYLLLAAWPRAALPWADLFFRLDPLASLGALLAGREVASRLILAALIVGLTLVLGRVWCSWVCPLGSLLDWLNPRPARQRRSEPSPGWRLVKYALLLVSLGAALFGSLAWLSLDPLALLTRAMTTAVLPALVYALNALLAVVYAVRPLQGLANGLDQALRSSFLPVRQPVFDQNWLTFGIVAGIIALNLVAARFWCRYVCPLGGLLSLLSRLALLRPVIGGACNRCGQCAEICPAGAIETERGHHLAPGECTMCLDCLALCPQAGIAFQLVLPWRRTLPTVQVDPPRPRRRPHPELPDPGRRLVLASLVAGAASVALGRSAARAQQPDARLIRPPGVDGEARFLARCLRCSLCMQVCPTAGLQPTGLQAGLEGLWTPRLVPRLGYCDYGCHACGQVCPSQAIPRLELSRKRQQVMGVAEIDRNRCLPWAEGIPCIVCEEMCPTPEKAIRLEEVATTDASGQPAVVQRPHVLRDSCIGCGICENRCPVSGEAAIQVRRL